jgi:small subunit ribosomal protein S16
VVVDSRNRRDGRYIENLGTYNPIPKATEIALKEDRILHWLGEGVQLSPTAESLIRSEGILEKFDLLKRGVKSEELEGKLGEQRAKQPRASGEKLSRADKKAAKKQSEREAAEAAKAEAASADAETEAEPEPAGENAEA